MYKDIKMKHLLLLSVLALTVSNIANAESLRWDSGSLYFLSTDVEDGDSLSGLGIQGMKSLNKNFFVFGLYERTHDYYGDYKTASAGLGYRYYVTRNIAFWGAVSGISLKLERGSPYSFNYRSEKNNGYGLQVGIRALATANIELSSSIQYIDIGDESQTGLGVSALYNFTKHLSTEVSLRKTDDSDTTALSFKYFF